MSKKGKLVIVLLILCVVLTILPFMAAAGSSFGGSDDAAGTAVEKLNPEYKPWAKPIAEVLIGGEIPAETESLLFCLQAAIGSGILCFGFGYLVARKKYSQEKPKKEVVENVPASTRQSDVRH